MIRRLGLAAALLAAVPAAALQGDLLFPVEGWALVGRWHLASGARSAREGWAVRQLPEAGWKRLAPGAALPSAPAGAWLRAIVEGEPRKWREPVLELDSLPATARVTWNGTALPGAGPWPVALRRGKNLLAVALPPPVPPLAPDEFAPRPRLRGIRRSDGEARTIVTPRAWRVRADDVEPAIPAAWLTGRDLSHLRVALAAPAPGAVPAAVPAPVCLKAVLEFPAYWRPAAMALFLHDLPGRPDVWLNGIRLAAAVACPARLDLAGRLKFDGRDALCLVWPAPPPDDGDGWGMVAMHWAASPAPPRLPAGAALRVDAPEWAGAEGVRRACRYATEVLAVSATPWELRIAPAPGATSAGVLLAPWASTVYRASEFDAALVAAGARCDALAAEGAGRLWVLAPPTVGRRRDGVANGRLQTFDHRLADFTAARNARLVPLYEVFRSALKRSRRWAVKTELSGDDGVLSPCGAYTAALVLLDTLAEP